MQDQYTRWLVETDWLADHLEAPDIAIVDGSFHMPATGRDGHGEFLERRIPGARYFDINEIADTHSPLPHMLPSAVRFSLAMRKMGIGDGMRIVVYDEGSYFGAARVWWMFRVMGVTDVVVLNGGLRKWLAEGRPISDGRPRVRDERHFTARRQAALVRDRDDVLAAVRNGHPKIVDARSPERFAGIAPEPRAGLRSGHIPGAVNVPYATLVADDGRMKSAGELRDVLDKAGLLGGEPTIAACGSGVSACIVALALAICGKTNASVYDGSWAEWGGDPDLPLATGSAHL